MERIEIVKKIEDYLKSKIENDVEINEETVLSDFGVESVEFVLLLVYIESELDVAFEDEDLLMTNDIKLCELVDRIIELQKI